MASICYNFRVYVILVLLTGACVQESSAQTSVGSTSPLNFGTGLAQGTPVTIDPIAGGASAGHFTVTGTTGAEVDALLTLPTNLLHNVDGATTLPVSFSTTSASWALSGIAQATSTAYDPSTTLTQSLDPITGELHIWLGGTISPSASQKDGAYSASITLDITYTGN